MLTKRTNVLFEEMDYAQLADLAKEKESTIGHLIREAVKKTYLSKKRVNKWAKILTRSKELTKGIKISSDEWREFINEGRKW